MTHEELVALALPAAKAAGIDPEEVWRVTISVDGIEVLYRRNGRMHVKVVKALWDAR